MNKHSALTFFLLLVNGHSIEAATIMDELPSYEQLKLEGKHVAVDQYFYHSKEKLIHLTHQVILCCVNQPVDPLEETGKLTPEYFYTNILTHIFAKKEFFEANRQNNMNGEAWEQYMTDEELYDLTDSFASSMKAYAQKHGLAGAHRSFELYHPSALILSDDPFPMAWTDKKSVFESNYTLSQEIYNEFHEQAENISNGDNYVKRGTQAGLGALIIAYLMSDWRSVAKIEKARKEAKNKVEVPIDNYYSFFP